MAWGFDNGGLHLPRSRGDPVYDPATLAGNGGAIPGAAEAAVAYADPLSELRLLAQRDGRRANCPGRPYATDSTFGSGHSTVLGSNPWYRSWVDVEWRMALNGALYPPAPIPVAGPGRAPGAAASEPLAEGALPKVKDRPVIRGVPVKLDARVVSYAGSESAVKKALRTAEVPKSVAARLRSPRRRASGL